MAQTVEQYLSLCEEDAYAFLAKLMFDCFKLKRQFEYADQGHDLYLPKAVNAYLRSSGHTELSPVLPEKAKEVINRAFFNAAWQMCLRGLLRPSAASEHYNQRGGGDGYSFTERGMSWFNRGDVDSVILSTSRMDQLLGAHAQRFGSGYAERVHEAVLCHSGRAFLACCVMCGAAAESVLLATAIAKENDETAVMAKYKAQSGRSAIEKMLFDGKKQGFIAQFKSGLELLKYWRDESAHGAATGFDDAEATVALNHLLRFAQLVDERWAELT